MKSLAITASGTVIGSRAASCYRSLGGCQADNRRESFDDEQWPGDIRWGLEKRMVGSQSVTIPIHGLAGRFVIRAEQNLSSKPVGSIGMQKVYGTAHLWSVFVDHDFQGLMFCNHIMKRLCGKRIHHSPCRFLLSSPVIVREGSV